MARIRRHEHHPQFLYRLVVEQWMVTRPERVRVLLPNQEVVFEREGSVPSSFSFTLTESYVKSTPLKQYTTNPMKIPLFLIRDKKRT